MRVPQIKENPKGSQKWLQEIINICPDCLIKPIQEKLTSLSNREIFWISPLKRDDYAEYRDADFLKQL